MTSAFKYVQEHGGIASEASYPYVAKQKTCNKDAPSVFSISSYKEIIRGDTTDLLNNLN